MNSALGKVVTGIMIDENDKDYFVQPDRNGQTYRLPKEESPQVLHIGGQVRGFVYENENHQLQMTCAHIPTVQVDHYDYGTVVNVRRDLGVFVDIGLPNKDIVVSLDDLPSLKHLWPQPGDRLLMALRVDEKDRLWGKLADEQIYQTISTAPNKGLLNRDTYATVYRLKMSGTFVITDNYHLGFIHPSERDQEPRLGQRVKVRVIGISSHGSLNLSLKPRSYQAIGEDAQMILTMLDHDINHRLPYTDKTDPTIIREVFGISKGQFKRAIGHLLKEKLVKQQDGQLILIKEKQE
ncbi:DNA-binding protein [Limosilactobacillus sp. STM2_1]|uniref:DNA-binding protein n=1 Tax=Limosilactobacillus rudii TaxID=2759755 RepID=A0A7W3YMW0_9LACO|nr:S1-like domain-containing RNA-binding protein [Limosilactobacillus rudii]MBB1078320.1 DNA-binding protein [Limosilactobacillus rudii]MBB1096916.1 DNA-binding protein [Limosilactobacillus rudii]MCD7134084.1 S1-like domain-containing RNA-binding protein [Limosilactobacillus rudii]